jgi:uncharacterized membrane protein YphA (DoxX/SURF4 family)
MFLLNLLIGPLVAFILAIFYAMFIPKGYFIMENSVFGEFIIILGAVFLVIIGKEIVRIVRDKNDNG